MHRPHGITRQQVMARLKTGGALTADELGDGLGISPVAARQHLAALNAAGLVTVTVERRGLGRPVHRYCLTVEGDERFPRVYADLAAAILDKVRAEGGAAAVSRALAGHFERTRAQCAPRLAGKPLAARVEETARALTEMGAMATAAPMADGYLLTEHNCVICRVARANPEACAAELHMLRDLLGPDAAVTPVGPRPGNGKGCAYRVAPVEAPAAQARAASTSARNRRAASSETPTNPSG